MSKKQKIHIRADTRFGTVRYKKISGNKKIKVTSNGYIKLPKGLKKGTYRIKVRITSSGDNIYRGTSVIRTIKIKVKKTKVYWTPGGKVYHLDKNCPGLSNVRRIMSGTKARSHKKRACKICW